MAQQRGWKTKVVLDYETSYGADPASPKGQGLPVNSFALAARENLVSPATITGRRDAVKPYRGLIDVAGQAVVPVDDSALGFWLKLMFGAPTSSAGPTNYTHTFKVGDTQPSAVIEKQLPDLTVAQYAKYNGVKVARAGFSFGGGDAELVATLDLLGAKETISATPIDSGVVDQALGNRLLFKHAALKEGGSTISTVTQLTLDVDFGLDGDTYVIGGGGFRGALHEGTVKVSGQITALFDAITLANKGVNGTESSLQVTLTYGANNYLDILVSELEFGRPAFEIPGPKGMVVQMPFEAYFNDASPDKTIVQIILANQKADYTPA